MAAIAFKQSCPSCEHAIPIRDAALVGKKIECPKCKYRFVVQKPKATAEDAAAPPPAKGAKPAAAKPKAVAPRQPEVDDGSEAVVAKNGSRKKIYIGLGLGVIGLIVLSLASFVILGKTGGTAKKSLPIVPIASGGKFDPDDDDPKDKEKEKDKEPDGANDGKAEVKAEPKPIVPKTVEEVVLTPAGPELTNLLPNDTEHVLHGFFKEVFDVLSPFRGPIAGDPRGLADSVFKPRLGFAIAEIDDFIRADRFTAKPWTFTVIHLKATIDEDAVKAAFGLKGMPSIRGHDYYQATKANPWFDQLSHIAVGVPQWLRLIGRDNSRPLFVRFHDRQTLIFANEAPMQELLKSDLQFPLLATAAPRGAGPIGKADGVRAKDKSDDEAKIADLAPAKNAPRAYVQTKSYLTINPKLKEMLDRLEAKPSEAQEKPLYSTATQLEPARVPNNLLSPDERGKTIWRGKQIWDLASMFEERKPRLVFAGSALVQREARVFQYRAELECADEKEAKSVLKFADESTAPELARHFERYLNHKIEIPKTDPIPQPNPGVVPLDPVPMKDVSRWESTQREQSIDVRVDLFLDNATLGRIQTLTGLFAMAARSEVDLLADPRGRHLLGQATLKLAEQGRDDRKIAAGSFPPGTVKRPAGPSRIGNMPFQRLSWMTSLLPFLGENNQGDGNLYQRIDFASSWRDPVNWLPARTIVPEFLDGSYPESSRFVAVPGMAVAPAATHFVGIAGVGLDAASEARDDAAFADKRGVFGYDRSATLADLQKGRGAANIVMVMQIPHDGLTGVSPWIAGGGSTLRGVPEKNSLAPFVLTNDKNGKPLTYKGQRGTYAIMADSSVRFLDASTPDEIVKALCTVQGPGPKPDFFGDEKFPIVPDSAAKVAPKVAAAAKTAPAEAQLKLEIAPLPANAGPIDGKKK